MNEVKLTDKQILLLEGDPAFAELVSAAKERLANTERFAYLNDAQRNLIAKIVEQANKEKFVNCRYARTTYCTLCGKSAGYGTYQRSSRNHRKGERDWSKPLSMNGIEFGESFVVNHIQLGGCLDCINNAVVGAVKEIVRDIQCEVNAELLTPERPNWTRYHNMKCECGWTGYEGEMYPVLTLMADGYYPGKCPSCGKENVLFAKYIRPTEGYTLVKMPRRIYTARGDYKASRFPIRPVDYEAGNFPISCANLQLEW